MGWEGTVKKILAEASEPYSYSAVPAEMKSER
jgi:hypothetical protein